MKESKFSTKLLHNHSPLPLVEGGGLGGSQQQVQTQQAPEQQKPYVAKEDPDTLYSTSYARGLDLLSEGPIAGLCYPTGRLITKFQHVPMAVYFDDVPLMNSDGSLNVKKVNLGLLAGIQDQLPIPGFGTPMDMIAGGQQIKSGFPVSIAIDNTDAHHIEVAVRINSLLTQNTENGDIHGGTVEYNVAIILNGDEAHKTFNYPVKIIGKASSPYIYSSLLLLPRSAPDAADFWTVRLARITPDSKTLSVANDTYLEFINVFGTGTFSYPNSAIASVEIDARGYANIPTRGYDCKLLKVKVPSNYFPDIRTYTRDALTGDDTGVAQIWDGTFYLAWTDNPAWCYYDLLTSTRYGLGEYLDVDSIDKWALYEIAQYCDETVDDGYGNQEPRFSCNVYIQSREEAYKVLSDFASVFRGINYYAQGTILTVQDRPKLPFVQFSNANVEQGVFSYSGTSQKARHTVAVVRYINIDDGFKPHYEYVEDWPGMQKYGYRETQLTAFACTSKGQAHRLGKWTLLSEQNATDTVIFRTGMLAGMLRPGDVFSVMDNNRSGTAQGGRVLAFNETRTVLRLDRQVTLYTGSNTISLHQAQISNVIPASISNSDVAAGRRNSNVTQYTIIVPPFPSGTTSFKTDEITLTSAVSADTSANTIFVIETPTVQKQLFRTLQVQETEDGKFEVSGSEYIDLVYDATEHDIVFVDPDITDLAPVFGKPPSPIEVKVDKFAAIFGGQLVLRFHLSWSPPPDYSVEGYLVTYYRNEDPPTIIATTQENYIEVDYQLTGTYVFSVVAKGRFGFNSDAVVVSIDIADVSPIASYKVTGLELVGKDGAGQGNDTDFDGPDANFQWRLNSPAASPAEIGTTGTTGVGTGSADPFFSDYEIVIWDISLSPNLAVWREIVNGTSFSYTLVKNKQSTSAPLTGRFQFRIDVTGRNKFGDKTETASLIVQNPPPQAPTNVQIRSTISAIWIDWIDTTQDLDFVYTNIYSSGTNDFAGASVIGTSQSGHFYFVVNDKARRYFWLRSVDTFGSESAITPVVSQVPGVVGQSDIGNFAIDASKLFINTVIVTGDSWHDNFNSANIGQQSNPPPGDKFYTSWNAHFLYYNGAEFHVAAGTTNQKYIYFTKNPAIIPPAPFYDTAYSTSDTAPILSDTQFLIATNVLGVHDIAWNALANEVIGSAYIASASINDAHIVAVSADKIYAGTIDAQIIKVAGLNGAIQSSDFVSGSVGWQIRGDGYAEFNNIVVREALSIGTLYFNSAFKDRLMYSRPTRYLSTVGSLDHHYNQNGGANAILHGYTMVTVTADNTKNYPDYTKPVTVTRRIKFNYGPSAFNPADNVLSAAQQVDALFVGVDVPDYTDYIGNTIKATPRRLAYDGYNVFTFAGYYVADTCWSLWFQICDSTSFYTPVHFIPPDGFVTPAYRTIMGNFSKQGTITGTPLPLADTRGAEWYFAKMVYNLGGVATSIPLYGRVRIKVPKDKTILFGIAPIRCDGARPDAVNDTMAKGIFEISAENTGFDPNDPEILTVAGPY